MSSRHCLCPRFGNSRRGNTFRFCLLTSLRCCLLFCAFSVFSWVFLRIAPDDSVRELEDGATDRCESRPTKEAGSSGQSFLCVHRKRTVLQWLKSFLCGHLYPRRKGFSFVGTAQQHSLAYESKRHSTRRGWRWTDGDESKKELVEQENICENFGRAHSALFADHEYRRQHTDKRDTVPE